MELSIRLRHFLILLLFPSFALAQEDSLTSEQQWDNILVFVYELPPLEELLQIATNRSSLVKSRDALIAVKENELKKIKNDWLDILSFRGNVGYGNSFIDVNQNNLNGGIASNINTVLFNVGVAVNLSPAYWVERKYEMKILKSYVAYERAMKDEAKLIVVQKITDAYVSLEYYRDIYTRASAGYESNRTTIQLARKQFLEGEINIATYNDIKLKDIKLKLEIEGYKQNLKKAYYTLQHLLGVGTPQ
ncbi:TolC family protein [Aureispira anguillae]|uniref:TolC family protein n=1 Tax=Aureispira anguillae TaxID=2864201 RepID=A0A915YM36_9BACT|nr:TolC family protein [Aureispira anguillae]BDS15544.1 TolC family protein [Aureispira anguillae]